MKLKDFDYNLPSELIAQYPCAVRDEARLMVVDRERQTITHSQFFELDRFLPQKALIVLNNSKVIPARIFGKREKTGGKVEIFLLNQLPDGYSYRAMIRPLKKLKAGEKIVFEGTGLHAELTDGPEKIIRFNRKDLMANLNGLGHMPLPPYIKRSDELLDQEFYQTVYAKEEGSLAAPTAGLHFSETMLARLKAAGHPIEEVTLHINQATFNPVKVDDLSDHVMHEEAFSISANTQESILEAGKTSTLIAAVGTTSCRVLETMGSLRRTHGATNIFIYPGYEFKLTDILITNFHLPKSTLLMLVYAFGGIELMKRAYAEAIQEKYRFYSYGDCMIII